MFEVNMKSFFVQIYLLDFGASRAYDKKFVDRYIKVNSEILTCLIFAQSLSLFSYSFLLDIRRKIF